MQIKEIPVIDMRETGLNLTRLRRQRGIRVKDIQEALGFTTTVAIYKWERGETLPSLDNILALSRMLGCSIEDILVTERDQRKC